jgi:prepilin-type N-terminal cleavage/methylation domain-containing protein/prepilin-type processing-associated H-X9-DG protein
MRPQCCARPATPYARQYGGHSWETGWRCKRCTRIRIPGEPDAGYAARRAAKEADDARVYAEGLAFDTSLCVALLLPPQGFTLIELLATLAVIAILVAMLLPALMRAKAKARQVQCASNQRQIGVALRLYVDDSRCYPMYGLWNPALGDYDASSRPTYWDAQLSPVCGTQVFNCPGHGITWQTNWTTRGVYPNQGVGYNCYGTLDRAAPKSLGLAQFFFSAYHPNFMPECSVLHAADMAAAADTDVFADDDGDGDLNPQKLYPLTLSGKWHSGRAVAAFCDGHTECQRFTTWQAQRTRWNNDGQPHL